VYLFHVICNIVEPVRLMVKPDTSNPPAAVRSSARHPSAALFQQSKTTICPSPRLPAHRDDDGIARYLAIVSPVEQPSGVIVTELQDPEAPEEVRAWVANLPGVKCGTSSCHIQGS
jgi:hypothetical protein